ncbi:MAG: sigma-70 family RNA polymerase sigma factor [Steroidobacteraceae bacterium]
MADGAWAIMPRMSAAAISDEALVAGYAAGDVAAFEQLYARHELALWRYLVRQCRDRATAEELMQEVWFAVTREAQRFRTDGHFLPWLYTIARHRVIDRHRAERPAQSLDAAIDGEESFGEGLEDVHSPSPLAASEQMEQGKAILAALGHLPPEQREAFVLQAEADLSVDDIARITGTTLETAKSRLRYARDKLKALLREHAP